MMSSADEFYGPVNIGNPGEFAILQLARIVIKLTESKSEIEFLPLPEDDPVQRKPDIELARKKIEWIPKIGLEEGLLETIKYFRNALKAS